MIKDIRRANNQSNFYVDHVSGLVNKFDKIYFDELVAEKKNLDEALDYFRLILSDDNTYDIAWAASYHIIRNMKLDVTLYNEAKKREWAETVKLLIPELKKIREEYINGKEKETNKITKTIS